MTQLRRVIREVHRRSLWQVLGIYLGASWVALQVVHHVTAAAGLPDWVPSFALILLLLFFPVVLATAFVQEADTASSAGAESRESTRETGPAAADAGPAAADAGRTPADGPRMRHRLLTWRNATLGLAGGFALMLLLVGGWMALRALGIGPAATLVAKGVMEERERIVLADFGNATADPTLGDVVTEALRIDLTRSPVVTVVDGAYVSRVLHRMRRDGTAPLDAELAREVAVREGLGVVLSGEVGTLGAGYLLTARLVASADGRELAAFRQSARSSSELIDAVDRLSREIRERVGESLRSIRGGEPLDQVSTSSLEALQKYSQAVRVREREADDRRSAALLEEAIRLDPEFAMAWRKLGVTTPDRSRQVEALERAHELRHRLPDRERYMAEGSYHQLVTERAHEAVRAYRTLLELYPDDVDALNNLALVYWEKLGGAEEAVELLRRANRLQPSSIQYLNLVPLLYIVEGPEASRAALEESRERYPDNVALNYGHSFFLTAAEGDYQAADSIARALSAAHPASPDARALSLANRAALARLRGRLTEGKSYLTEAEALVAELGRPHEALAWVTETAVVEAELLGDLEGAARRLDAAVARYSMDSMPALDRPYLALARAYAAARRLEEARAWLRADEIGLPGQGTERALRRELIRVLIQVTPGSGASEEDLEAAVRVARSIPEMSQEPPYQLWLLGRVWEARGEPDSALAAYRSYLDSPHPMRVFSDGQLLGPMLERMAELHAERGEHREAAALLDRWDELWSDADPPLRARVERARAALAGRAPPEPAEAAVVEAAAGE